jgi:hypothetical protein
MENLDAYEQKVLRTFLEDGKLKSIPARHKKRGVILRFLANRFEPGRMYSEREVNEIIREYHEDVASLRRYLVDTGLLERQIVRVVEVKALMQGAPQVEHHITYWKSGNEAEPTAS